MLRRFVNALTADEKCSGSNIQNLPQQFQTPISHKQKTFSEFFIALLKCAWKLEHFQKKRWVSWPNYFPNYWSWKTWLLKRLKGLAFEHNSLMNVLTGSKHCWNPQGTTITLFSRQSEVNWVRKSPPSVWYEMLRLFVNALTADDKYSGSNMQNLRQQFQTPLSRKQRTFSVFFIAFLKCAWNLENFQKKMSVLA